MTYGNYPDWGVIKKVLVVKLRHHGDVLLTSPLFSALRAAHPSLQLDAFLYQETLPMLEGHPAINHYILYDRAQKRRGVWNRMTHEISLLYRIRRERYDLVLNL